MVIGYDKQRKVSFAHCQSRFKMYKMKKKSLRYRTEMNGFIENPPPPLGA